MIPVALAALLSVVPAHAALVEFRVSTNGEKTKATVETVDVGGVAYVSLPGLTRDFGGGYTALGGEVQIDFGGGSARLLFDDTLVDASLSVFRLDHPIRRAEDGEALMALADIESFFAKSFGADLRRRELGAGGGSLKVGEAGASPVSSEPSPQGWDGPTEPHRIRTVLVDPGHGGNDAGCQGAGGLREKDLVLDLALRLETALNETPEFQSVLTRREDVDLVLTERAQIAQASRGDVLITLHAGASFSRSAHGFDLFYDLPPRPSAAESPFTGIETVAGAVMNDYSGESRRMAEALAEGFRVETGGDVRGIHQAPCALLKRVSMPAVLIEVGCLTNPAEETLLQQHDYRDGIVKGIIAGLKQYASLAANAGVGETL